MNNKQCFPHEFGARNDPKLLDLQMDMGGQGLAIWWCLVEMLHENKGTLPLKPRLIAYQLRWCEASEVERVIREFGLFIIDDEKALFWNRSALAHCEAKGRESEARAEAGRRGGQANGKQTESKPEANGKQTESKPEANGKQMLSTCRHINSIQYNSIQDNNITQTGAGAGAPTREEEEDFFMSKFFFRNFANPEDEVKRCLTHYSESGIKNRDAVAKTWTPENTTPRFDDPRSLQWALRLWALVGSNDDGHTAAECLRHVYNIKVDKGRNELTVSMRGLDWKEKVWGLVQNVPALHEGFESIAVSKYVNS